MGLYRSVKLPKKEAEVSKNTGLYQSDAENHDNLLKKEAVAQNLGSDASMSEIVDNTVQLWHQHD